MGTMRILVHFPAAGSEWMVISELSRIHGQVDRDTGFGVGTRLVDTITQIGFGVGRHDLDGRQHHPGVRPFRVR